jgi:hypothetical protein
MLYCIYKQGRGYALFHCIFNKVSFVRRGQSDEGNKGGTMESFIKHVDYHNLTAIEAVSMVAVAVVAVANGVLFALNIGLA